MRRFWVVPVLLAACITSTAALAAQDKATATFESLGAAGISGEATLRALPTGGTQIHATIRGLEPGVEYFVALYPDNQTCAAGSASQQVVRVIPNPAGMVTFNEWVSNDLALIGSLSVQLVSDQSVQACAAVTPSQ